MAGHLVKQAYNSLQSAWGHLHKVLMQAQAAHPTIYKAVTELIRAGERYRAYNFAKDPIAWAKHWIEFAENALSTIANFVGKVSQKIWDAIQSAIDGLMNAASYLLEVIFAEPEHS